MGTDLDTFAIAAYVRIDDFLKDRPDLAQPRPTTGITPKLSDAELLTLAIIQAMLGFRSEHHFIRYAHTHLLDMFPNMCGQSGYNKRLRKAATQLAVLTRLFATETDLWTDDTWVIDSTPVECGRSRDTAKRSELAGVAGYGYCASHTRYFWGVRLHLVCTPAGLPVTFAITHPKTDERETFRAMLEAEPGLLANRPGQTLIADKGYASREFDAFLHDQGARLIRPTFKREPARPGAEYIRPFRQLIESVNDTLKGQLDLERHGGRTPTGLCTRITQRLLALTAAIWHNNTTNHRPRHLTSYDH